MVPKRITSSAGKNCAGFQLNEWFLDASRAAAVYRVFIQHIIREDRWTDMWHQQHSSDVKAALAPESSLVVFDLVVVKQR
jgi:hypothetical protein